jgi:hypothetical protein
VASLLGCYLVLGALPQKAGWEGLGDFIRTILWTFAGLIAAACIGLVSLGFGIACARWRKRVLFWVVPLWLAAAFGVVAGLVQLILLADEHLRFIPGGKQDDLSTLLAVWLGSVNLFYLAYWIVSKVWGLKFRFFPLWSAPLWAILPTVATCLLG